MLRALAATLVAVAALTGLPSPVAAAPVIAGVAVHPQGGRWWTTTPDGAVSAVQGAVFHGDMRHARLNRPVVGIASTPTGNGYWLVASDGGIFTFGDARFFGSTGGIRLNQPVVGMASTPTGHGYWLVARDGGIFTFGDARFFGSTGGMRLNRPIVAMTPASNGNGYWLVASDGGIFTFGDTRFFGSTGGMRLNAPVVGMAATPSGNGYWLVAADGGIFTFGSATFRGSGVSMYAPKSFGMAPDGRGGYYVLRVDGSVLHLAAPGGGPGGGTGGAGGNPLSGMTFYGPNQWALNQATSWSASRPADSELMRRLGNTPTARWFASSKENPRTAAAAAVRDASSRGATRVLVVYRIPNRDCGNYSGGGAADEASYKTWIDEFAAGIGSERPVVIVEPDALAQLCGDVAARYRMIKYAVDTLAARTSAVVYLDGGHPNWISAPEMADRLQKAGIAGARGFATNVASFKTTSSVVTYGDTISAITGKHYVIDTSRNGSGPSPEGWCNPSGRSVGASPTASTGLAKVDAFLWVKTPGLSDGSCNGGPAAGQWWADYALGLASRAWG